MNEKDPRVPEDERSRSDEQPSSGSHTDERRAQETARTFFRTNVSSAILEKGLRVARRLKTAIHGAGRTAVDIARRFFTQESAVDDFSGFDPVEYLRLYYPEIDPAQVNAISKAIRQSEQNGVVSLSLLKENLSQSDAHEVGAETLENYCIYDFMLRRAIPRILQEIPDDHLHILDIGGGPTIYQHIPLIGIADSIVHAEYLEANRDELQSWKSGLSTFSWASYVQYCQEYFRSNAGQFSMATPDVQERLRSFAEQPEATAENDLRDRITQIIPVNAFVPDLGIPTDIRPDVVNVSREGSIELMTSNFCIESATADPELWKQGIKNICDQVPAGKFLLMTAIRNAEHYTVGDKTMPAVPVNGESITVELRAQGFEILELQELTGSNKQSVGYDGMVFVLAKKRGR